MKFFFFLCLVEVFSFFFPRTSSVLQAVTTSKTGVVNNLIQVSSTDFEVFDALRIDSQDSADLSGANSSFYLIDVTVTSFRRHQFQDAAQTD